MVKALYSAVGGAAPTTADNINGQREKEDTKDVARRATLTCLCAISLIRGADVQILPASFRAMEVDLNIDPFTLGIMALCQGVAAAISGPFWGNLVDSGLARTALLKYGAATWGFCTICLAFAKSLTYMAILRILNGMSLAMLLPVVQSFVAELAKPADRGSVFGLLAFFGNVGQVLACLIVTPVSNLDVYGVPGWRFSLAAVGTASIVITALVPMMITEEPRTWRPERLGLRREVRKLAGFMQIPSFRVIVMQGIFGTIPGAAFSFITMYFQYVGISDLLAAMVISLSVMGDAFGSLCGGMIGDMLANWSPRYGRAICAQISALAAIPMVWVIFLVIPQNPSMVTTFGGCLFLYGFLSSWVAPGCISPVICDIVPKSSLGSAYAWELAIVFCSGSFLGPLLVGGLSEGMFGYQMTREQVSSMPLAVQQQNARALGKALFVSSAIPYVISAFIFMFLFQTHDSDRRRMLELGDVCASESGGESRRLVNDERSSSSSPSEQNTRG
eukprot:TRINITY_DN29629_c0_g1_i1.p1 TRINITY_DN29629_c0_g1~~TRINITY_DN29629_c0_g1_i1.p1  ORF type:complete len:533 (+),score=73.31 TRINITY_DN29629_c0_g1_i1:88-1599(+)